MLRRLIVTALQTWMEAMCWFWLISTTITGAVALGFVWQAMGVLLGGVIGLVFGFLALIPSFGLLLVWLDIRDSIKKIEVN
ncbi:MAG: hypothetical protein ACE5IR_17930 [bacterium]